MPDSEREAVTDLTCQNPGPPLAVSKPTLLNMTALSLHDKEEGSGQVEAEGMLLGDRAHQPLHPLPFALCPENS